MGLKGVTKVDDDGGTGTLRPTSPVRPPPRTPGMGEQRVVPITSSIEEGEERGEVGRFGPPVVPHTGDGSRTSEPRLPRQLGGAPESQCRLYTESSNKVQGGRIRSPTVSGRWVHPQYAVREKGTGVEYPTTKRTRERPRKTRYDSPSGLPSTIRSCLNTTFVLSAEHVTCRLRPPPVLLDPRVLCVKTYSTHKGPTRVLSRLFPPPHTRSE